jgi:CHASE2 domain-containing sensor protein
MLLWFLKILTFNLDILNPVEDALENFSIMDTFFEIQHSTTESDSNDLITIVDMTDLHKRGDIAMLLEEINMNNPLLVGIDLIFEGVKDDSHGNGQLEEVSQKITDITVFSRKLTDYDGSRGEFTGSVRSYFANSLSITEAYTNLNSNMSGACIREFSLKQICNGEEILSFPAKIASTFDESLLLRENEGILINFKNVKFNVVKWNEIAENSDLIDNHIVLVGTMAEEQDMHMTPLGKMSGLELQAFSLLTLLEHKNIKMFPNWLTLLFAFIACLFLELIISVVHRWIDKYPNNALGIFVKESEITLLMLLFLFVVLICLLSFLLFVYNSIVIESGVVVTAFILLVEGRKIYFAMKLAFSKSKVRRELVNYLQKKMNDTQHQ